MKWGSGQYQAQSVCKYISKHECLSPSAVDTYIHTNPKLRKQRSLPRLLIPRVK